MLSPAGDRVYRAGDKDRKPADVTAQLKLATASKAAVLGDFDADGRLDVLSWDGRSLKLAVQSADGTFAAPKECGALAECLSMECVGVGTSRPGVVVGTAGGPLLLTRDAEGAFKAQPLAAQPEKDVLAKLGDGGLCVTGDFNGDGLCDVMSLHARGALLYAGAGAGKFKPAELIAVALVDQPRSAVCGDFDADGRLDVVVGGKGALALLSREGADPSAAESRPSGKAPADAWYNATHVTGELAYHGGQNQPQVTACVPCSPNTDGRQGVGLFYTDRKPLMFFNRGFACFGWAREWDLNPAAAAPEGGNPMEPAAAEPKAAAPDDLQGGQTAGAILDLNGDGVSDMLAVGAKANEVWMAAAQRDQGQGRRTCSLVLPPGEAGPLTVTVKDKDRVAGMYVVRAGLPAVVARSQAGPLTLNWTGADGMALSRRVVLVADGARVEVAPPAAVPGDK